MLPARLARVQNHVHIIDKQSNGLPWGKQRWAGSYSIVARNGSEKRSWHLIIQLSGNVDVISVVTTLRRFARFGPGSKTKYNFFFQMPYFIAVSKLLVTGNLRESLRADFDVVTAQASISNTCSKHYATLWIREHEIPKDDQNQHNGLHQGHRSASPCKKRS